MRNAKAIRLVRRFTIDEAAPFMELVIFTFIRLASRLDIRAQDDFFQVPSPDTPQAFRLITIRGGFGAF